MKKLIAITSAVALGLGLAACNGGAEDEQVDMVEEQADAMEDAGQITDEQADAMVEQAEEQADAMEDTATDDLTTDTTTTETTDPAETM